MSEIGAIGGAGGSLQRKLSLTLLATIVLVFPPIMLAVDNTARDAVKEELRERHRTALTLNAAALSRPLEEGDYANLARLAAVIAGSDEVDGVLIADLFGEEVARSPGFDFSPEQTADSRDAAALREISRSPITREDGRRIGTLSLRFNTDRLSEAMRAFYWRFGLALTLSLALLFATLMLAMRWMMLRPLSILMSAIERTGANGARQLAAWRSRDELGRLVGHFNAMQVKLSEEEAKLKCANVHLSALYNKTPAMLFSIDKDGRIADVSDYWSAMTGYAREEAVGEKLERFLERPERAAASRPTEHAGFEQRSGRFMKRSGDVIDVYISRAAEPVRLAGDEARSLLVMVDITSLKRAEAELLRQARTDSLTSLPNRRHFQERLEEELTEAAEAGAAVQVCLIDLDRFKWVNDHLGHHAGDEILARCGKRIDEALPGDAFLARLGGDEFAIFKKGGADCAKKLARRINDLLSEPFTICGSTVAVTASIGIAGYPENAGSVDELLRAADLAMYRTKRAGRRGFSCYDSSIGDEARRLFEAEELMKNAAPEERFFLEYQPIIRLDTGATAGSEALLRMRDDKGGVVSPADFIPVAEESGMMPELGGFALRQGLAEFRHLARGEAGPALRMAVNLSPAQVTRALPEQIAAALEAADFPADRLVLEITESVFLKNDAALAQIFDQLRGLGCRLALDDFGTGYSSLSYLNDFPVDIVKIDRQFIRRLGAEDGADPELERRSRSLLQGVAAIAEALGLSAVAEGVETETQHRLVREMGFEFGQGFLWSRPIGVDAFEERLRRERPWAKAS